MSSLDDFFAKRELKKSSTKVYYMAVNDLYRTLAKNVKADKGLENVENPKVEATKTSKESINSLKVLDGENEWSELGKECHPRYSNARSLSSKANYAPEVVVDPIGDGLDVDNLTDDISKSPCPWLMGTNGLPAKGVEIPLRTTMTPSNLPGKKSVYVPPALREEESNRVKKHETPNFTNDAPDLTNTEFFPSLYKLEVQKRSN